jgi:hypothetical protein
MMWGAMMWQETLYRQDPLAHSGDRNVSLHYPRHRATITEDTPESGTIYNAIPDWYTATIPRMAIPSHLMGNHKFSATHFTTQYASTRAPATTFAQWVSQLPPAEQRLISSVYFAECNRADLQIWDDTQCNGAKLGN